MSLSFLFPLALCDLMNELCVWEEIESERPLVSVTIEIDTLPIPIVLLLSLEILHPCFPLPPLLKCLRLNVISAFLDDTECIAGALCPSLRLSRSGKARNMKI